MISNVNLCVTLTLLSRDAFQRGDEGACTIYGKAMKHFIRTRGITTKDCDRAMLLIQSMYHSKPTVTMAKVISIHRGRGTIDVTGESNEAL